MIDEDPGAASAVAIDHTSLALADGAEPLIFFESFEAFVAGAEDEALAASVAFEQSAVLREESVVVFAALRIKKVGSGEAPFSSLKRVEACGGSDHDGLAADAFFGEEAKEGVEAEAVTADGDEVDGADVGVEDMDGGATVGGEIFGVLVDADEAVGSGEGADGAGAGAEGVGGEPFASSHEVDEAVLGPSYDGRNFDRNFSVDGGVVFVLGASGELADEGGEEFVEGEDGGSGEAWEYGHGFSSDACEAEGFSRFEGDSVDNDACGAGKFFGEFFDDAGVEVASAFGGSSGEDEDVGAFFPSEGGFKAFFEDGFVVGNDAQEFGLASGFGDGVGDDAGVGVVDLSEGQGGSGGDDFVAGGGDGNSGRIVDFD